jgi:di/tricarboxylate transporter
MPRARAYPTAPLAAASLIGGYAVAVATGSRPLGGIMLAAGGLACIRRWAMRRDKRTAAQLAAVGLTAFVLSHVLALAVGAWPAVLLVSGATATIVWLRADAPALDSI